MSLEFVRVKEEIDQIDWESVENEDTKCVNERDLESNEFLHVKIERECSVTNSCLRVSDKEFDTTLSRVKKETEDCGLRSVTIKEEKWDEVSEECGNVKREKEFELDTSLAEQEVKRDLILGPERLQLQDIVFLQANNTVAYKYVEEKQEPRGTPESSRLLENQDKKSFGLHTSTTEQSLTDDKELSNTFRLNVKTKSNSYLRIQRSKQVNLRVFEGHPEPRKYICDTCGKQFPRKINVIVHLRSHLNQARCVCDICNKRYTNMFNLKRHKLIHVGDKPHCCDVCNRRFTDPCNLVSHKRLHSEEKPYTCNVCHKQFRQNAHLRGHMRVHTGEKPFPCKICNKQFSSVYNLNRHKRTHTGEKPFSCEFCDKQFADVRNLARHKLLHTKEPAPYECDVCLKPFRDYSNLGRHKQIHSGVTFKCETCRKRFSNLYNLNRHKRYRCRAPKKVKVESD